MIQKNLLAENEEFSKIIVELDKIDWSKLDKESAACFGTLSGAVQNALNRTKIKKALFVQSYRLMLAMILCMLIILGIGVPITSAIAGPMLLLLCVIIDCFFSLRKCKKNITISETNLMKKIQLLKEKFPKNVD